MIERDTIGNKIREEYLKVRNNNEELRALFNRYNYLNIADLAQAIGINKSHLYRLRKRVGLVEPGEKRINKTKKYRDGPIELPEDWMTKEKFLLLYETYGAARLSEATGLTKNAIWIKKTRFTPTWGKYNSYDTREWCYRNYILGDRSQKECAKMAGVSSSTFHQWLCKHDIDRKKSRNYAVPLYIKELAKNLLEQPIVKNVKFRNGYLKVNYRSYTAEGYYYTVRRTKNYPKAYKIQPSDTSIEKAYDIQYVYGVGMDGENHYPMHFRMNKNYSEMSFMEKRLAFHSFLAEMVNRKWASLKHPEHVLANDLEACRNLNIDKYWLDDSELKSWSSLTPAGTFLAEHFFYHTYGPKVFCNKYVHARYMLLKKMVKTRSDITISDFMRCVNANPNDMIKKYWGHRIKFYKDFGSVYSILKKFNIQGSMLDLSPGYGYNALAAAMAGIKYYAKPGNKIYRTLGDGFSDFVGLDYGEFTGQKVDLLLYHNYYFPSEVVIQQFYKYAKRMIIFVPKKEHNRFVKIYKPEMVIKYHKRSVHKDYDFLMIW